MSRYRFEIDNVRAHVRSLWWVIALQFLLIVGLWWGWSTAPSRLTVHIPPDLRAGVTLAAGEVRPANVYTFTYYVFQQLNRWPMNGAVDYGEAIFRLSPYLTPGYREQLIQELALKGERGELVYRTRSVEAEHADADSQVQILDQHSWQVDLDLRLVESVRGMTVKETAIRYPIRVVRQPIDPELNPWGLALDGFVEPGPKRLQADPEPVG